MWETGSSILPASSAPRGPHDERDLHGLLEERHLVPQPPLAKHVSVVGREDDHGVIREIALVQRGHDLA